MHEVTGALGGFITYFSNFCKRKIGDGWLTEREDPKKLKESLTNIVTTLNSCYNKSWWLCQKGRRKYNNLREVFPDTKIQRQNSLRGISQDLFLLQMVPIQNLFFNQSNIYDGAFL